MKDQCPKRGGIIDAGKNTTSNREPKLGDYTICLHCAAITVFGADLRLRAMTPTEVMVAAKNERLNDARRQVLNKIRARNAQNN